MEPEWIEEEFEVEATHLSVNKGNKNLGVEINANSPSAKRRIRQNAVRRLRNRYRMSTNMIIGFNVVVEQYDNSKAVSGLIIPTDEKAAEKIFLNTVQWPIKLEPVRTRGRNDQLTVFRTEGFRENINPESKEFFYTIIFFDEKGETIIKENYVVDLTDDQRGRFRTKAEEVDSTTEGDDSTSPVKDEEAQEPTLPIKGR